MSIYLISNIITDIDSIENQELPSQTGGGPYPISYLKSLEEYKSLELSIDDTVIYDLRLALNKDGLIDNDKVWDDINSNEKYSTSSEDVTINLIIYAFSELVDASWKNVILKRNNFSTFPKFTVLIFDGPDEDSIHVYWKATSVEITGWGDLPILNIDCFNYIYTLDISGNNVAKIDFDGLFEGNIRSIKMRNMIINGNNLGDGDITINQSTLEYLDITNTVCNRLALSVDKLNQLIGFTSNTLKTIKIEGEDGEEKTVHPSLSLSSFKLPINLSNFPSDISVVLSYVDYFPTGLDTIEKIETLNIDNCKNVNAVRNLYINDCYNIYFRCIYKINKIKINKISKYTVDGENKNWITMITNIDLVTLELPNQDFSTIAVILYANINLSEIICDGISYGKEDDDENDLFALCENVLKIKLYDISNYKNSDQEGIKHRLGFNKLYINEKKRNFYNINPQIYKNRELIGDPLDKLYDVNGDLTYVDNKLIYNDVEYSYIKLPKLATTINAAKVMNILTNNVIDYNGNNVEFTFTWYANFVALGLTETTANSFVNNIDKREDEGVIFTNSPGLLKDVKNGKVINLFTYAPDLPNVFGIKLVVY